MPKANMETERPKAWCVCLSAVLIIIGIFAVLTTPLSSWDHGTDPKPRVRPECSNPNILGSQPQTFTYYYARHNAAQHGNMSLLAQASKVLD